MNHRVIGVSLLVASSFTVSGLSQELAEVRNVCPRIVNMLVDNGSDPNPKRIIEDRITHRLWLFSRNLVHPAAPARLVPVNRDALGTAIDQTNAGCDAHPAAAGHSFLMVRAGDSLMVHEHTPVSDALLAGTAVSNANREGTLRVRLQIGGRVVLARVNDTGNATVIPDECGQVEGGGK